MKRRTDEGAVLIVVLIVTTIIAVVLGALLSFADTSLRTTIALRGQASTGADADGAVQAAINNLRNSTATAAGNCFGSSNTLALPAFDGTTSAAVSCGADPSSAVRIQCPSLSNCNRPGNAILTLGTVAGENGLSIAQPNTSAFRVHGSVYSNSTINVASGSLTASSGVYAKGACTGSIQSTPAASCSSSAANPLGADPGYAPAAGSVPAHQSMPACTSKNSVVKFSPGYYDDAAALSDMMSGSNGKSKCTGSVWWFQPGVYYFDFHNAGANSNPLLDSGSGDVWTVNDGKLIAGTLTSSTAIPGACVNPIEDPSANGVQFIFGGDSQMVVKAAQAEICGGWQFNNAGDVKPPIAVYGLGSGSESTTSKTLGVTSVPSAGDFGNATPATLGAADGTDAAAFKSTNAKLSGSLTVGVTPTTAIPAGSILKSATVRVIHRHGDTSTTDNLAVSVTPTGGSASAAASMTGEKGGTGWNSDQLPIALTTNPNDQQLAAAVYAGAFTGAQIAITSTLGVKNDTESIDAVQLDLSYVTPSLRAETGCVITGPYTGGSSSSCAVITTTNSPGSQFYVQGTTYAPKAVLDISLNNLSEQVFRFGVISRALQIKQTGSFSYAGPVIEVPDDAPGFSYAIYLTAYVCPAAPSCPATGIPVLRAKVAIVDAVPSAPAAGRRQIAILSWTPTG